MSTSSTFKEDKDTNTNKEETTTQTINNPPPQKPQKKKAELIIISNDDCSFNNPNTNNNSLQANFKNFRSYISSLKKQNKVLYQPQSFRENPIRMSELREKFLSTAKTLLGIPYGKKYLIAHPDYDGGVFLDCCALVRRTVSILKEEFGFSLSRWNQAYQFDVLPDEIPYEEMKPGDLVFYSGIYYPDLNLKEQPHNMTHVEIFLGEGEKTIGSRDSTGVVSIYDTFQFASENYYNIEYHFKSIDTWLKGIHRSFCNEHKWHEEVNKGNEKNKYSIFYENAEEEAEEEKKEEDKKE
jgi:hypothetical protein